MYYKDWYNIDADGSLTKKPLTTEEPTYEVDAKGYFSPYVLGKTFTDPRIALYSGFRAAKNIFIGMKLSKVNLCFEKHPKLGVGSLLKNHRSVIPTSIWDDEEISLEHRMDVFLGGAVHEAMHYAYTDFSRRIGGSFKEKIMHFIWELVEDERVEKKLAEEYPGFYHYLVGYNEYKYQSVYKKHIAAGDKEIAELLAQEAGAPLVTSPFAVALNVLVRMIRYPYDLDDDIMTEFEVLLQECYHVVYPVGSSAKDSWRKTEILFDILNEHYKKEISEHIDSWEEAKRLNEEMRKEISERLAHLKSLTKEEKEQLKADLRRLQEESKKFSEESKKFSEAEKLMEKEVLASVVPLLTKEMSAEEVEYMEEMSKLLKGESDLGDKLREEFSADFIKGTCAEVYFYPVEDNMDKYLEDAKEVSPYTGATKKALSYETKDYKVAYKGMKSGTLDVGKLVEASIGDDKVHERFAHVKSNKLAVVLVVDCSGSMSASVQGSKDLHRIDFARKAAILLREALVTNKDVELFIYGHTADHFKEDATEIFIYQEPGHSKKFTLGNCEACSNNRDGQAIFEIGKRVRSLTTTSAIMFVVSDGQPSAQSYYGDLAVEDTKKNVKRVEAMDMQVVQLAIDSSYDPSKMFSKFVRMCDIPTLPKMLTALVTKMIKKVHKIDITI